MNYYNKLPPELYGGSHTGAFLRSGGKRRGTSYAQSKSGIISRLFSGTGKVGQGRSRVVFPIDKTLTGKSRK